MKLDPESPLSYQNPLPTQRGSGTPVPIHLSSKKGGRIVKVLRERIEKMGF
jgi:hypothetical protein